MDCQRELLSDLGYQPRQGWNDFIQKEFELWYELDSATIRLLTKKQCQRDINKNGTKVVAILLKKKMIIVEWYQKLLKKNIATQLFSAQMESTASELAARMTAMDNATRNAGDLIDRLTLQYNRTRQAFITKELIEIISGAEAL